MLSTVSPPHRVPEAIRRPPATQSRSSRGHASRWRTRSRSLPFWISASPIADDARNGEMSNGLSVRHRFTVNAIGYPIDEHACFPLGGHGALTGWYVVTNGPQFEGK